MEIKTNAVNFTIDKKLVEYINDKVSKLELFFDQIITCEVFLKTDKSSEKENKYAGIKLIIPKSELFAEKQCKSFEEAIDLSVEALRKQIIKHKEKVRD
ncbi:MAG TPA: ribosome-associated translation inhibitor RaiA [Crocinitomicaceae bacterium]|nr:ribosome-associated translation inhibitor RaiA [Crocinitomicaceae bacterium]